VTFYQVPGLDNDQQIQLAAFYFLALLEGYLYILTDTFNTALENVKKLLEQEPTNMNLIKTCGTM